MSAREKSRFTTAQAGWIALVVFAGWLVFLFVPTSRKPKPAASTALPPVVAQSKLESVGLSNNPDWYGLPDYFTIWADRFALDENDQMQFAYWNPGSRSYSYFFEVKRKQGAYQFRALTKQESAMTEHLVADMLGEKTEPDTHPFVFPYVRVPPTERLVTPPPKMGIQANKDENPSMKVDLPVKPMPVPPPPPPKSESH